MLLMLDHLAQLQESIPVGVKYSVQQIQLIPPHLLATHQAAHDNRPKAPNATPAVQLS